MKENHPLRKLPCRHIAKLCAHNKALQRSLAFDGSAAGRIIAAIIIDQNHYIPNRLVRHRFKPIEEQHMTITWKELGDEWLVEDPQMALGWHNGRQAGEAGTLQHQLRDYLHMQLAVAGLAVPEQPDDESLWRRTLLSSLREKNRLLAGHRPAIDQRIESFLNSHFGDAPIDAPLALPHPSLCLDRHGIGRLLSLPADGDHFSNELLSSYRVHNGVIHNPRADRRTTQGTFHVCEGGLPIPADKRAIPKAVFARLFQQACRPPAESLQLPYLSASDGAATSVRVAVGPSTGMPGCQLDSAATRRWRCASSPRVV